MVVVSRAGAGVELVAPTPAAAGDDLLAVVVDEVGAVLDELRVEVGDMHGGAGGLALVVERREQVEHRGAHQLGDARRVGRQRQSLGRQRQSPHSRPVGGVASGRRRDHSSQATLSLACQGSNDPPVGVLRNPRHGPVRRPFPACVLHATGHCGFLGALSKAPLFRSGSEHVAGRGIDDRCGRCPSVSCARRRTVACGRQASVWPSAPKRLLATTTRRIGRALSASIACGPSRVPQVTWHAR